MTQPARSCAILLRHALLLAAALLWALAGWAAESLPHSNERLTASLLTAEDGVHPDASAVSGALYVDLAPGWKTYWRSPGEVGYPPSIDWTGSKNVTGAEFFWPTPERFVAFDVENYGYSKQVVFPLRIELSDPGQPAELVARVSLLTCAEICVPEEFELRVDLPSGSGIDTSVTREIAAAVAKVPGQGEEIGLEITNVRLSEDQLTLSLGSATPLTEDPTLFPDLGEEGAFGEPSYAYNTDRSGVRVTLPVLSNPDNAPPLRLVVATPQGAAEFEPEIATGLSGPAPSAGPGLLMILIFAFLGGAILNVMPCVLPVLSIKLTSAMSMQDKSPTRIRAGFLAAAAGVLAFMLSLALILIAIRAAGGSIGWGIQFQSPIFLSLMIAIMVLFAANMAGLFEITLPQNLMTRLARADGSPGLAGDFATGALAAVLATPCSAPFLGTAVTVALAGAAPVTLGIFTALGLGLALPYLLVALRPSLVTRLPKPGQWMIWVKWGLALLLAGTAAWLAFVLGRISGGAVVAAVLGLLIFAVGWLAFSSSGKAIGRALIAAALAIAIPALLPTPVTVGSSTRYAESYWTAWDMAEVSTQVASGQTVFIDVTADWCLTCKTNKTLVLDRAPVSDILAGDTVTAMRADWTRPNDSILSYLQGNGRFGIPFNIVYGPDAPEGIALPEILTTEAVLQAIRDAGGTLAEVDG